MNPGSSGFGSLAMLVLVVAVVVACFFMWLLLSSCLGTSIINELRELWNAAIRSARSDSGAGPRGIRTASARRRRELGLTEADIDLWEMEALGARRGG